MRFPHLTLLCTALLTICSGCLNQNIIKATGTNTVEASAKMIEKQLKTGSFHRIEMSGPAQVVYTQAGGACSLRVSTPDNLLPYITVAVKGNCLELGLGGLAQNTSIRFKENQKITFYITAPNLQEVTLNGTGDFISKKLNTDNFELSLNGTGDFKTDVMRCRDFNAMLAGTGDIKIPLLKGNVFSATLGGTGDIKIKQAQLAEFSLNCGGTGDTEINRLSTDKVRAIIGGTGNITLAGTAGEAEYIIGGCGDITARNLECQQVSANISGSGDITCTATYSIQAATRGTGDITYWGNPEKVHVSENVKHGR